jgi:hypothetical protein
VGVVKRCAVFGASADNGDKIEVELLVCEDDAIDIEIGVVIGHRFERMTVNLGQFLDAVDGLFYRKEREDG